MLTIFCPLGQTHKLIIYNKQYSQYYMTDKFDSLVFIHMLLYTGIWNTISLNFNNSFLKNNIM